MSSYEIALGEFFTHQHRVIGRVRSGGQRLSDLLNDDLDSTVELRDAQVYRHINPTEVVQRRTTALVEKKAVLFALSKKEGVESTKRSYYKRVDTAEWEVFMTVPSFELTGKLHVRGTGDLRTAMLTWTGRFVPFSDGKAVFALFPEVSFASDVIIVNKSHMELICIDAKLAL